jgi:hypothetical protein
VAQRPWRRKGRGTERQQRIGESDASAKSLAIGPPAFIFCELGAASPVRRMREQPHWRRLASENGRFGALGTRLEPFRAPKTQEKWRVLL